MAEVSGGERLERALQELGRKLGRGGAVKVGYLANATYPDGKSVAMIGAIQEFGAPARNIPPRPAIRNMIREKSKDWPESAANILRHTNNDVPLTLQMLGEGIKGQWQQAIRDLWSPPLAPATVKRKGFDKPLISTSHMLNSVAWEVSDR
jgi:hypothetical protein